MSEIANGADTAALLQRKLGRLQEKLTKASEHIKERDEEIKRLKAAAPAEGSQAVTAADAELLTAYKALGTPEALKKAKDDGEAAAKRVKSLERKDAVAAQAKEAGVDPDALWWLLERDEAAEIEVTEVDGRKALQVKRGAEVLTPEQAWGVGARTLTAAAPVAPETPQQRQRPALPAQRPATKPAPRQVTDEDIDLDILKRHGTSL
jgi:hypothetical protein